MFVDWTEGGEEGGVRPLVRGTEVSIYGVCSGRETVWCREVDLLAPVGGLGCDFGAEGVVACGRDEPSRGRGKMDWKAVLIPRKLGTFFIWISSFFSIGSSKKAFPSPMTSWVRDSGIPVFVM